MKILLIKLFMLLNLSVSYGAEIDRFQLILPVSYTRNPTIGQNALSRSGVWIGNKFGMTNIQERVDKALDPYRNELAPFFKAPNELNTFVSSLVNEANQNIIHNDGMTDDEGIQTLRFFGDRLVGKIFDRILSVKGEIPPDRRIMWNTKILTPFNLCIARAENAMFAASHCLDALTASLLPNIGMALTYEMSLAKLASTVPENNRANFLAEQVTTYQKCIPRTNNVTADQVTNCAMNSMRIGILKISEPQLLKTLNETLGNQAETNKIKTIVWPKFEACIKGVSAKAADPAKDFISCVDILTSEAGGLATQSLIANKQAVKDQFSKSEVASIANEYNQKFRKCADDLIAKNIRKNGMIDIDSCKNTITNQVTYRVLLKTLTNNSSSSLKGKLSNNIDKANKVAKESLDKCWDNNAKTSEIDKCAKSAIINFAKYVGELKLNLAVPNDLEGKSKVVSDSMNLLISCMEKQIPNNVTSAPNAGDKVTTCSNKVTRETARKVATLKIESTFKNKISKKDTDDFIAKYINDEFMKCLTENPTDELLASCPDKLTIAATDKVLTAQLNSTITDKPSLSYAIIRTALKTKLMGEITSCLKTKKGEEKDACTDELFKSADRAIVLAYGRAEASFQLTATKLPTKFDPIEEKFEACVNTNLRGKELSTYLDECNKEYALSFAKTLGEIKLNDVLEKALGSNEFKKKEEILNNLIGKYNNCIDALKAYSMEDKFTERITVCTKELENNALNIVRGTLTDWMTSDKKDSLTLEVKNQFAFFIPCLSVLMAPSPYDDKLRGNVDSILKPVAEMLAQYIDYSPEDAKRNLSEIINQLAKDLKDTTNTEAAKINLIDLLYKNGALDQLIKGMVLGEVKKGFAEVSEADLPNSIVTKLLSKETIDQVFASEEGKKIKDYVLNNILKPILLNNADMSSPAMVAHSDEVKSNVTKLLLYSPQFGDTIIKAGVQNKLDQTGGFTRFIVKVVFGKGHLEWEKVRTTEKGRKAEEYIRENVLLPKFKGQSLSKAEQSRISAEAEKLVKDAIMNMKGR